MRSMSGAKVIWENKILSYISFFWDSELVGMSVNLYFKLGVNVFLVFTFCTFFILVFTFYFYCF